MEYSDIWLEIAEIQRILEEGLKRSQKRTKINKPSQNKYNVLSSLNQMDLDKYIEREVRHTLKPLREIWLNIGLEKIDTHEGVSVKALLNSGAMGLFMSKRLTERKGFKLEKLGRLLRVRNVDGSDNSRGAITYEAKANVYYKGHVERVRLGVYELGKVNVILGMPWLVVHNPEINWEIGEVKITRYPPICGKYMGKKDIAKKEIVKRKKARKTDIDDEKDLRWIIGEKERIEGMREDHRKVEEMVPLVIEGIQKSRI